MIKKALDSIGSNKRILRLTKQSRRQPGPGAPGNLYQAGSHQLFEFSVEALAAPYFCVSVPGDNMRYLFLLLLFLSSNVYADQTDFIEKFISDQYVPSDTGMVSDTKSGELIDTIKIGTNNQYAVHWIFRVANYWEERITLLSPEEIGYKEIATIHSEGQIKEITVKGDILILNELGYGKDTPRCCPDKEIVNSYKIFSDKLVKVKSH